MADVGSLAILLAWLLAIYGISTSLYGAYSRRRDFIESGENATLAVFGLVVVASAALIHGLVTSDFSLKYVAHYTSTTLPLHYKVAAFWGGQAGSLLFWLLILTSMAAVVVMQNRERNRALMPFVNATLLVVALFFLSLISFITPPFEKLAFVPPEGRDLNPLLQNYWMTIHPPALYLGFVGCTVPFAFAMAALATGRLDDVWIRTTRRWTLFAWFFLSLGNLFGAQWAYLVLGWGGYWAWDPVENAAFMPWLTCTAFLHSVMIQEKKGMLKVWNMVLVILTFLLTIFGTFLTRSGVISSVHSFTQSGLGPLFMGFLIFLAIVSFAMLFWRLKMLRSQNELDSLLSRETAFLLNNLIFVAICFAVFWGTIFPVVSEWVRGVKITVGPPFFNTVNAPLGLFLLFLTGIGPVIAWRRATASNLRRNVLPPMVVGLVVGAVLFVAGMRHYYAIVSFSLCGFVAATVIMEFWRGVRARQAMMSEAPHVALARLIGKNRRRYGGYIIHLGIVLMFLAFTGMSAFKVEKQITVSPGDRFDIGNYTLVYEGTSALDTAHIAYLMANIAVVRDGEQIDLLKPEKRFYKKPEQPTTEVAIRSTLGSDLYLVLGSYDDATKLATIIAYINPLIGFLWYGGLVLVFGTFVTIWPQRVQAPSRAFVAQRDSVPAD